MVTALLMLTWIIEQASSIRAGIELLLVFVAVGANDVTKMFFWTPHVQIYNLFLGCLTVFLVFRLIERSQPPGVREVIGLALAIGIGVLIYGAFLIPLMCVSLILLVWYRRPLTAALFAIVGAPAVCRLGSHAARDDRPFYSHEVAAFRQFVWIADCAKMPGALPAGCRHQPAAVLQCGISGSDRAVPPARWMSDRWLHLAGALTRATRSSSRDWTGDRAHVRSDRRLPRGDGLLPGTSGLAARAAGACGGGAGASGVSACDHTAPSMAASMRACSSRWRLSLDTDVTAGTLRVTNPACAAARRRMIAPPSARPGVVGRTSRGAS